MAELVAVRGDTCTPISMAVLIDGREVTVSGVISGTLTIDGITVNLTPDEPSNRVIGTLQATLTDVAGVFAGTGSLVTNTGTYTFPDSGLSLIVLESYRTPTMFLMTESLDFLMTEAADFLMVEV